MKDNELYDFFKNRKQAFDETPGDALWARIENGLESPPSPPIQTKGLSLLKKLLILPILGVAIVIIWFVAYNPKTVENQLQPNNVTIPEVTGSENPKAKIIENTDAYKSMADTVKQNLPVKLVAADTLVIKSLIANPGIIVTTDSLQFASETIKTEIRTTPVHITTTEIQQLNDTFSKQAGAFGLKPETIHLKTEPVEKRFYSNIIITLSSRETDLLKAEKLFIPQNDTLIIPEVIHFSKGEVITAPYSAFKPGEKP